MSERRGLTSGVVLANRYELQDQVSERLGSVTWRALDLLLNRNVGVELIPSSDPRAPHFLEAARLSTTVTDARFLRVLDLLEDENGHHVVVREWAKAFGLNQVLEHSPVPSRRAAQIVAEVAEALAHAHERGVYHRRLTPHHVLVKQSGAVRIVGLGLASALDQPDHAESASDLQAYEQADVHGLGHLLYAALTGRWPGVEVDHLPSAPHEHGHTLRPRQVRAGVSREIDAICARILPELAAPHTDGPLTSAAAIARALRLIGDEPGDGGPPTLVSGKGTRESPDLLRADPVVAPAGPVPGLTATRRPKAHEPAPPTRRERAQALAVDAARDDRRFVIAGVMGVLAILLVIGGLAVQGAGMNVIPFTGDGDTRTLPIDSVQDFDPQGDGSENPDDAPLAIDGDPDTGWQTTTYFSRPEFGGLKDGVGLVVDLGHVRRIREVDVTFAGSPTSLRVYGSAGRPPPPDKVTTLVTLGSAKDVRRRAQIQVPERTTARYLVIWLTSLPEVSGGKYQGEVREITVRGSAK
ncbi:MAG TPA: protein kinase family protein [Aeromicrobium sp.]|nr:protein kinase family protein [Aeromicrobium sp.]